MGNHPVRGKNYFRSNILDNNLDGKPPCLGKNYSRSNLLDNNSDGNSPTIEKKLIQMGKGTTLSGKKIHQLEKKKLSKSIQENYSESNILENNPDGEPGKII